MAGRYYEDMALVIKILHNFDRMVTVPDTYYYYRINSNSTVAQKTFKHTRDYNWALKELLDYAMNNNIKLELKHIRRKKEFYKFLNITLMKVYHYYYKTEYKLLGFIPLITKRIV